MRINLCGVKIDRITLDEAVDLIVNHAVLNNEPEYVVTPNAQHILLLQDDSHFSEIYANAFLVVADGVPLVWASQLLGKSLPGRVNGTDLFEQLCKVAAEKGLRVFLLGGRPQAAEHAAKLLQQRHPDLNVVGTYCPPYGFETDQEELVAINAKIRAAAPHLLFVGLGAPKQEYWMYHNYQKIGVPISIGIGGSFELVSGLVPRAPIWMQKTGLEWFFRLLAEPRRLWKRYILGNPHFVWLVFRQWLSQSLSEKTS
ncbi:WecB/TagA/CpsF family glycosyltransferase [Chroococcidiopsis sp. TS-821]|uniref:WecB/TagA/CpsF family glycosyltransferase n=1 Tax=Chroococcidiopsis sp. TS-821 TaxID=1378066 RepID=UPI000CEDAEFC|nr:WecB/TagA/CpsF family glycosyltransferase [Chroococcidiopsis sp. TS-821]PPS44233.1 glycosyltransferase [Chroococcidiopsis sp. TS-821]